MQGVFKTDYAALKGRRKIYTTVADITAENVVSVLNTALGLHIANLAEEEYLYWYRRGVQPILERTKTIRKEINNRIVENHATEIVSFKNGYFLTRPAFYISRRDTAEIAGKVNQLNDFLYVSGKQQADNEVTDWFHTVGLGVVYVEPNDDDACPFLAYSVDPRTAFVVYSREPGNRPVMGVNTVLTGVRNSDSTAEAVFDVYTRNRVFRVLGSITANIVTGTPIIGTAIRVMEERANVIGEIPLIEYQYDTNRMGAFESVVPLLDAINNIGSNRVDGIEQFIQALMIFYNCELGEDEQGNEITPEYIREAGAVFLKSIGQDKADLKVLSEQLDQSQTQVLVDYLYQQVLTICGMPSTTKGGTSTSDTGQAVLYRDGWYQADTYARNTSDLFRVSNRNFDRVVLKILDRRFGGFGLGMSDIELQFARNETANILVKTQAAMNMKELGFAPEIALGRSGLSNDPVADVANSRKYMNAVWEPAQEQKQADNTETINETRTEVAAD